MIARSCFTICVFLLGALLFEEVASPQGGVIFNNRANGTSHVYEPDPYDLGRSIIGQGTNDGNPSGITSYAGLAAIGADGHGQTAWATLFAAPGSNQPESALRQWTEVGGYPQVIWFNTGDRAGSVIPVVAHFTNVPPDAPVATVQMRVWDNRTSVFSWDQVLADPTLARGVSPTFNVYNIGGGVNVPPYLFPGLVSFNMFTPAATNPIMLLNPRRDANSIAFDFLVKLGKTYHVEYKSNLSDTLWNELTSVVGTGFTNFTDTTPTNDARFYRVRVQ